MIHPVSQGSEAWHILRRGKPTASDFDQILTPELKARTGQMPLTYAYQKAAELITGVACDQASSFQMEQGQILESEAVPFLELLWDRPIKRVGFITDDAMRIGCSPDGLLSDDEGLELKCPTGPVHLQYLIEGVLPKCYAPQVHGSLYVSGFKAWTFVSYHRKLPPLVVRVDRDEEIMKQIADAMTAWLERFDAIIAKVDSMKTPRQLKRESKS